MNCIRCGAEVALDQERHAYVAIQDGGDFCPSSLSGEAAIHRVSAKPPARPKAKGPWYQSTPVQVIGGFAAGRLVGKMLFGGTNVANETRDQFFSNMQQIYNQNRPQ